ncbi:unnamed protein product [Effrenium voratum]|nr:unnamed protein product [Effrenium voratum]
MVARLREPSHLGNVLLSLSGFLLLLALAGPSFVPGSRIALRRAQRGARSLLRAVAEPPPRLRFPETSVEQELRKEWTECLIRNPDATNLRMETWVFRTQDYGDFEDFLKLRGFQNEGQEASLTCRERTTDPEIRCSECVRLLKGGFYGHLGVSVPAYPPQGEAMGCLGLSKVIDMPAPATEEDDSGDWDGAEGRQTAFCNSVNVRFEKASLAERGEATRSSERSSLQRHRIHELVHLLDSEAESLKAMARTLRKESGGIEDQISEAEESAAITAATAGVGMLNSAQSAVGATRDAGARDAGQALRGSPEQVRAQSLEELGRQTETSFAQQDARPGRRSQTSKTLSPEEQRLQALLDMR